MEPSDVDDMFKEIEDEYTEKPYSYAEEVMKNIEQEYRQPQMVLSEREKEKADLNLKIGSLKRRLHQLKNVKNPRKTAINQTMSERRKLVKDEIERAKDRLHQIDMEEKGSEVTSKNLVDSTINQNMKR